MKILIVGGTGYLGPVIADRILSLLKPEKLDAIDADWFTAAALAEYKTPFTKIDKQDKRIISEDVLKQYDVVIDLAAVSNDPMGADFEDVTIEINCKAAVNLAKTAKRAGVKRFIFASSCSIYGAAGDERRSEEAEKNPLTAYAKSKWQAEVDLEPLADENFSVIALRFATACGWSPTFRADLVLNDFVATALTQKNILVLSDGTPWRPLVHVRDIGRAVAWAAQVQHEGFSAYNVGSNIWTLTIRDLASKVAEILDVPYEITGQGSTDKRSYCVSFDKFEAAAKGWLPLEQVDSAVGEMKEQLTRHQEKLQDFRQGSLIRLNMLRAKIKRGELDNSLMPIASVAI